MPIDQLIPGKAHFISLAQAIAMTSLYRAEKENILDKDSKGRNILPLCETFNRAEFDQVLSNDACVGLRFYYSMDEDLKLHMIVVGVNIENEDILPDSSEEERVIAASSGIIDTGNRCPMDCPPASPLNS